MDQALVLDYTVRAAMLMLLLSLAPTLVATVVGLLVSLLQALTQIQEQTLGFAVKLVAVAATLLLSMSWLGAEMYNYTLGIFEAIPRLGR
jgi:type III secretion protein S